MSFATYGDLASSFHTRHLQARLKQDLTQLGKELSTGLKADMSTATSGDFGPLAGIEHSLKLITAQNQAIDEAALFVGASQTVLENIHGQAQDLSNGLIAALGSHNSIMIQSSSADAREKFVSIVGNLNADIGGRTLFAGAATNGSALADADDILAELMVEVSSETTAAGVAARIDAWFNTPGGGFETSGYLGAETPISSFRLGDGETASQPVKADDDEIRNLLSALAKSAIIAEGALAGDESAQKDLASYASEGMLSANDQLIFVRARVGAVEARIEESEAQNAAEKAALELSRNEMVVADPFETATAMQALLEQINTMYMVTSRLSSLNFTDYMR